MIVVGVVVDHQLVRVMRELAFGPVPAPMKFLGQFTVVMPAQLRLLHVHLE